MGIGWAQHFAYPESFHGAISAMGAFFVFKLTQKERS